MAIAIYSDFLFSTNLTSNFVSSVDKKPRNLSNLLPRSLARIMTQRLLIRDWERVCSRLLELNMRFVSSPYMDMLMGDEKEQKHKLTDFAEMKQQLHSSQIVLITVFR